MAPSLVIFSVSASPSFISKWLRINTSCHAWPTPAGCSGRHTWVRDRGHGEDGRSECKQSLSLNCQRGSGALGDSARLRPQDKNVFDIVCNCVMFALLVSGGGGSASANRRLIVSYGRVKHSLWNSGRQEGSLDMELAGDLKRRLQFSLDGGEKFANPKIPMRRLLFDSMCRIHQ